jgi:hypothetical protein
MFENELREFLKKFNCNGTELFEFVLQCKNDLKVRFPEQKISPVKLETSVKKYDNGKVITGRYSITLPMVEFAHFKIEYQYKIFKMIHFNMNKFIKLFETGLINQICFGEDNGKGKLYFGGNDGTNLCFESDGLTKHYRFITSRWMEVINIDQPDKVISVYKILKDGNRLGWVSINKDYITKYYRPSVSISLKEFNKLSLQDQYEYEEINFWEKHECRNCENEFINEDNDKSLETIVREVRRTLK